MFWNVFFCEGHGHTMHIVKQQWLFFFFSAYQNNDITEFEKILKTNHSNIMDDPFIREHIEGEWWTWLRSRCVGETLGFYFFSFKCSLLIMWSCLSELLRNIRTQVLIKLIKPYTRIHIPFISKVSRTSHKVSHEVTELSSLLFYHIVLNSYQMNISARGSSLYIYLK